MKFKTQLQEYGDVISNEEMKSHTSFRIGGRVAYSFYPFSIDSLVAAMPLLEESGLPYKVVGKGSNLLWCDEDIDMIVIFLDHYFHNYHFENDILDAEAGCVVPLLANAAKNEGLSGLEFASGIPATLGGTIFMNAGAYKKEMKDIVESVEVIQNGQLVWMSASELDFSYRHSILKDHPDWIVVRARLKLERQDKDEIESCMESRRQRRMESQPLDKPSAGSTFKNPETVAAWQLIDDCGLRGYQIGGARVSPKHSNFIVNEKNATCQDVKELIEFIQTKVKETHQIQLCTEVEHVTCQKIKKK